MQEDSTAACTPPKHDIFPQIEGLMAKHIVIIRALNTFNSGSPWTTATKTLQKCLGAIPLSKQLKEVPDETVHELFVCFQSTTAVRITV